MKIVLLGYMGSGKSTIGRLLAKRFDFQFIDLDDYIEQLEQMKIPQIFTEKGEIYFRKKESRHLRKVLEENDDIVLSLGGGTPCYARNMVDILRLTKKVIYLKVSVLGLSTRLQKEKSDRPLIKNISDNDLPKFIGKHLFERNIFYQKAKITIDCDGKDVVVIVSEIAKELV